MKSSRHPLSVPAKFRPRPTVNAIAAAILVCALAGTLAACGGGGSSSSSTASTGGTESALTRLLPAKYREKGELTVALEANYPPAEFVEPGGSAIVGFEPELAEALGEALGTKISLQNTTFDAILPGISSGKYDLAMSAINVTPEREKVFDLVSYFSAGTSFFVDGEGGPEIGSLEALCGHSVAVQRGTIDQEFAEEQKQKCEEGGGAVVSVNVFPDQSGANLAIASGRAEVGMADSPVVAYEVSQSNGKLKVTGEPFESSPYGIAVQKESGLAKPLLAAVEKIMADGTYDTILEKWNIESGALEEPTINGAAK